MSETQPTFNQVDEQLSNDQAASVLVERTDGSIGVGQVMEHGEHGARAFFANLNSEENTDRRIETKRVSADKLTDEYQEKLASGLAGVALRSVEAAVVSTPQSELPPARTSDRPGYWQKPTQEQIDRAAKSGYDLTKQSKYYSYVSLKLNILQLLARSFFILYMS